MSVGDCNSGSIAFGGLYTLLSTSLAFWKQATCMSTPLSHGTNASASAVVEGVTASSSPNPSFSFSPSHAPRGNAPPLVNIITTDERTFMTSMRTLFGGDEGKANKLMDQIRNMRIDNVEVLISELIGIPIPSHTLDLSLVTVQGNMGAQVASLQNYFQPKVTESHHNHHHPSHHSSHHDDNNQHHYNPDKHGHQAWKKKNHDHEYHFEPVLPASPISRSPQQMQRWDTKSAHRLAKSSHGSAPIISEQEYDDDNDEENDDNDDYIDGDYHNEHGANEDRHHHPTGNWVSASASKSKHQNHIQEEGQATQHKHRIEQVTMYTKELQHKLDGRRAILKGLLHLLRASQNSPNNRKGRPNSNGGNSRTSDSDFNNYQTNLSSSDNIASKLNILQKRLLFEMQKKRSTRMDLVSLTSVTY
jgi:hypothetical protein